jgi:hypothetical protein
MWASVWFVSVCVRGCAYGGWWVVGCVGREVHDEIQSVATSKDFSRMSAHRGDLPIGICVPSARVGVCGLCGVCFEDGPMTQEGDGERGLSVLAAWVACGQCHIFTPCMAQSRPTRFEFLRSVKRVHTACKMPSAIESVMAKAPTQRVRPMHTHLEEQAIGRGVGKKVLSHKVTLKWYSEY